MEADICYDRAMGMDPLHNRFRSLVDSTFTGVFFDFSQNSIKNSPKKRPAAASDTSAASPPTEKADGFEMAMDDYKRLMNGTREV